MEKQVVIQTGLGQVIAGWADGCLSGIRLGRLEHHAPLGPPRAVEGAPPDADGEALVRALVGYFSGGRAGLPEPPMGGYTPFQQAVWRAARQVPYGETRSYGEVARAVGRPGAARAVGAALGKNPFVLAVPCHRVVGANGALTGFACGIEWKAALLKWEGFGV